MVPYQLNKAKLAKENIEVIEDIRWRCVLQYNTLMDTKWKKIFELMPTCKMFYGCYKDRKVCFHYDGYGLGKDYITENDSDGKHFVQCLNDNELPLYINSHNNSVKNEVAKRLAGAIECQPVPFRQDIVDLYYWVEVRSQRIFKVQGYCNSILDSHINDLYLRMRPIGGYVYPQVVVCLNNRVYVYQEGKFIIKPEDNRVIFFKGDILSKIPVKDMPPRNLNLSVVDSKE